MTLDRASFGLHGLHNFTHSAGNSHTCSLLYPAIHLPLSMATSLLSSLLSSLLLLLVTFSLPSSLSAVTLQFSLVYSSSLDNSTRSNPNFPAEFISEICHYNSDWSLQWFSVVSAENSANQKILIKIYVDSGGDSENSAIQASLNGYYMNSVWDNGILPYLSQLQSLSVQCCGQFLSLSTTCSSSCSNSTATTFTLVIAIVVAIVAAVLFCGISRAIYRNHRRKKLETAMFPQHHTIPARRRSQSLPADMILPDLVLLRSQRSEIKAKTARNKPEKAAIQVKVQQPSRGRSQSLPDINEQIISHAQNHGNDAESQRLERYIQQISFAGAQKGISGEILDFPVNKLAAQRDISVSRERSQASNVNCSQRSDRSNSITSHLNHLLQTPVSTTTSVNISSHNLPQPNQPNYGNNNDNNENNGSKALSKLQLIQSKHERSHSLQRSHFSGLQHFAINENPRRSPDFQHDQSPLFLIKKVMVSRGDDDASDLV
jgi:hypothetical protein